MNKKTVVCEIEAVFDMIGGKWKPLILCMLAENTVMRPGEMRRAAFGISQKMLTNQLRELEEDGFLEKTVYPEVPPRVEYRLSAKGLSVMPVLDAMCLWFDQHPSARYSFICPLCLDQGR